VIPYAYTRGPRRDGSALPYRVCRSRLIQSPEVVAAARRFWDLMQTLTVEDGADVGQGEVSLASYVTVHVRINKALSAGNFDQQDAERSAQQDWARPKHGLVYD
jgi:hypothetical protein